MFPLFMTPEYFHSVVLKIKNNFKVLVITLLCYDIFGKPPCYLDHSIEF